MKNNKTPRIKQTADGSIEFYAGGPNPINGLFFALMFLSIFIGMCFFGDTNTEKFVRILSFILLCSFFLPFFFKAIASGQISEFPFITLTSYGIKIEDQDYLWQEIQSIHYTKSYPKGPNRNMLYSEYLTFYFSKKGDSKEINFSDLNKIERTVFLDNIQKHKRIINDDLLTQKLLQQEIGQKELQQLKHIMSFFWIIVVLFLALIIILFIRK